MGLSRERFLQALNAEGVPGWPGWPTPLYQNPLFELQGDGPEHCPRSCPYYGREIDYPSVRCPEAEQACNDGCWIPHAVLLAEPEAMERIVEAVGKVVAHAGEVA